MACNQNCQFKRKSILCGICTRSQCKYPNDAPDKWDYNKKGECWTLECSITNRECKGNCLEHVNRKIQSLMESNSYMQEKINQNKEEILKLKVLFN